MNFSAAVDRHSHWWLDRCFLYVGRMAKNKGVSQILYAWLELADNLGAACPPLWLVGGEPLEIEAIRRLINIPALTTHETTGRVKWWGYLDPAGISTLLLKAYVLVTHSQYEPGGRVVLEAMSQGIPVIATAHGFAADLIKDWHNGFLVTYGDVYSLRRRMEHFALQPLLRHAMGRKAEQIASAALNKWNFIDTHLSVYKRAMENTPFKALRMTEPPFHFVDNDPTPRGFNGVYPFESETVGRSEAAGFFKRHKGEFDGELNELLPSGGRSRIWTVSCSGRLWTIKHAFSTYRTRPMWDYGFGGSAVETQDVRISSEVLAASFCNGAAPVTAADVRIGLILREWMEPLSLSSRTLIQCARLLSRFHTSRHPSINLESIHSRLNQEWHKMKDETLLTRLTELQTIWEKEEHSWDVWQPLSIRLAWRWLKLGLSRDWLSLPAPLKNEIKALIDEESAIVADEESKLKFGFCHGDCDPQHFRVDARQVVLIDCERFYPGYFGYDLAGLLRPFLNNMSKVDASKLLKGIFDVLEPDLCSPELLLSWLRWINIRQICKSNALLETEKLKAELLNWRKVPRLANICRALSR
jgi:Glycosyl transferases group 1/Phosphotransferase enzyme family